MVVTSSAESIGEQENHIAYQGQKESRFTDDGAIDLIEIEEKKKVRGRERNKTQS